MFGTFLAVGKSIILGRISTAGIRAKRIGSRCGEDRNFVLETRKAIIKNTEISRDHLTPEIRLHLLTPNCSLYHESPPRIKSENSEDPGDFGDAATATTFREPFWSIYWPGGQALTRFVLDHGDELFSNGNSNVLDIGTGSGATAIAAKLRGARDVVANDIEPVACVAVDMNAALNDIRLTQISRDNLIAKNYGDTQDHKTFDFIFVGDLLYDEEISVVLEPWLDQAIDKGARIFLGDPGRHGVTEKLKKKLRIIRTYDLPDNVKRENYGFQTATVYEFTKSHRY